MEVGVEVVVAALDLTLVGLVFSQEDAYDLVMTV